MKLTQRFTLVFVLYAAALLGGMAWLAYDSGRDSLRSATISELQSISIEKQAAFNDWVQGKREDIRLQAASPAMVEKAAAVLAASPGSPEAQVARDQFVAEVQPRVDRDQFTILMLLAPSDGQVIAATDPGEEGKFKEDRPFFLNGRYDSYVQNIYYSISTQGPAITISAPIHSADGKLLGVLAGRLDLEDLNAIINRRAGYWQTEEAFLVNASRLFVTQPRLSPDPAVLLRGVQTTVVDRCLEQISGVASDLDYRGIPALIVHRWLPDRELCLIVKIDQAEALAPADAFGRNIIAISAAGLVAAIVLAAIFSRSLTRPIRALRTGVARFGQGEFGLRLPETSRDELGELSSEFNRMAISIEEKERQLRAYSLDLERRVEERTADIQQSEERFRLVTEASPNAVIMVNREGKISLANQGAISLFGYSHEALIGSPIEMLIPERFRANHPFLRGEFFEAPNPRPMGKGRELFALRKNGTELSVEIGLSPVETREGLFTLATITDITERKRAEEALRRFELLSDHSRDMILFMRRDDGRILEANTAALRAYGYGREELLSLSIQDLRAPNTQNLTTDQMAQADVSGILFETVHLRKDGSTFPVEVSSQGATTGGTRTLVSIIRDTTQRKRAEDELRESEERFNIIFNKVPFSGVLSSPKDGTILDVNEAFERVFGFSKDEAVGKTSLELGINPDSESRLRILAELQAQGSVHEVELKLHTKSKGDRDFLVNIDLLEIRGQKFILQTAQDITERKRAEEEIESLSRFPTENPNPVLRATNDGWLTHANAASRGLLEMWNCEVESYLPADMKDSITAAVESQSIKSVDLPCGDKVYSLLLVPVLENQYVNIYGSDITERNRAEIALQNSEDRLNRAQEIARLGSWERDFIQNQMTWSDEVYRIFGFQPQEFEATYETFLEFVHPEDRAAVDEICSESVRQGKNGFEIEHRIVSQPDSEVRIVHEKCEHVWDEAGQIIRSIGMVHDITERKKAEQAFLESEVRYRHTLDAMLEGCQIIGLDWRYLYLNDVADRHNRRPKEELLGQRYMDMWPGIESTLVFSVIRECMEARTSQFMENEFAFPDGAIGWFELRIYPVPEGIVILSIDITERKDAERDLQRTLDELRRSNAELEQFAYVASHDLQEPLRGIAGFVQLLQMRYQGQLDSRADEYISLIVDSTQRMQTLINDLLTYSRVGRLGDVTQTTEAKTALKTALDNLTAAIHEFGVRITNDELPRVKADPTQLIQLFQNLIGNAIKFRSERPPEIHIGVEEAGNFWQFSVQDNGIGIEPQYFQRIFLVFQRLHTRREYQGTGIGLAICKKIIERHGGNIWIESEIGQGSTFYFTLQKG